MIFPAAPMIDILVYLFENYADFAADAARR